MTMPLLQYFDPVAQAASARIIDSGPRYLAHALMAPEPGDFRVLETTGDTMLLIHGEDGVQRIVSNVCRHQHAFIIQRGGDGKSRCGNLRNLPGRKLLCPIHHWSYDGTGRHCAAPHFSADVRIDLPTIAPKQWNGLLYDGNIMPADIANLGHSGLFDRALVDFSRYRFYRSDPPTHYNFSWELFVEIYMDLAHVVPFHPRTLAQYVDIRQADWEIGASYNVQVVGWKRHAANAIPEVMRQRDATNKFWGPNGPPLGALWITIFPNIMVEWYPLGLTISVIVPDGHGRCVNYLDRFVPLAFGADAEEFSAIHEAAYNFVALEDAAICDNIQVARAAAFRRGDHSRGPAHPELEKGIPLFHQYLTERLGANYGDHNG